MYDKHCVPCLIYEEAKIYYRVWGVKRGEEGPRNKSSGIQGSGVANCEGGRGWLGGWGKRRLRITDKAGYTGKLNSHLVCVFRCRSNESYKLGASQGGRRRILHSYGLWCLLSIHNNCFCNGNKLCVGQHPQLFQDDCHSANPAVLRHIETREHMNPPFAFQHLPQSDTIR